MNDDAFIARIIREPLYRQGACQRCGVVMLGFTPEPRDECGCCVEPPRKANPEIGDPVRLDRILTQLRSERCR